MANRPGQSMLPGARLSHSSTSGQGPSKHHHPGPRFPSPKAGPPARHALTRIPHPAAAPPNARFYLRPGVLRPARIFCTRKGRPRRQLRAVETLRIWPPCQGCGWEGRERTSDRNTLLPSLGCSATGSRPRTHPFHDPAVHLHPLPGHWGRPGARPAATKPPPEWEKEETLAPASQLRNLGLRWGLRGLAEAWKQRLLRKTGCSRNEPWHPAPRTRDLRVQRQCACAPRGP